MNMIVKFMPGLTGAVCGHALMKPVSWNRPGFEFASLLHTCTVANVLMESAMRSYGNKL